MDYKNRNKRRKLFLTIFVIGLTFMLIGTTFAMFENISTTNVYSFSGGSIKIDLETDNNDIVLTNSVPIANIDYTTYATKIDFTVTEKNTSRYDVYYSINLVNDTDIIGYNRFKNSEVSVSLTDSNGLEYYCGPLSGLEDRNIYNSKIGSETNNNVKEFSLYLWINESVTIGDDSTYTEDEFEHCYTNLKIEIVGSKNEVKTSRANTPSYCFTTRYAEYEGHPDQLAIIEYRGYNTPDEGGGSTEYRDTYYHDPKYIACGNNVSIPNMIYGEKVYMINELAFRSNHQITDLYISDNVVLGRFAFGDCTSLENIELGENIALSQGTFSEDTSLLNVSIPSTTNLHDGCFYGCTNLETAAFLEGPNRLNYSPYVSFGFFENCTSLKEVYLSSNITYLDSEAFVGCTSLTDIYLNRRDFSDNPNLDFSSSFYNNVRLHVPTGVKSIIQNDWNYSGLNPNNIIEDYNI